MYYDFIILIKYRLKIIRRSECKSNSKIQGAPCNRSRNKFTYGGLKQAKHRQKVVKEQMLTDDDNDVAMDTGKRWRKMMIQTAAISFRKSQ